MKFIRKDESHHRIYKCSLCPEGTISISDDRFYGKCTHCGATLIDYIPLQHQEAFHSSTAQYRLNIGGFGSGKTTAAVAEVVAHALSTPNGMTLITAPILRQVTYAVLPELRRFLPTWFIEHEKASPTPYYKLTNGHEIVVFASNDQDNLRSLNLSAFYIEEASAVSYDIFSQLMTRLRNKAGIVKDANGVETGYTYKGILSTNPEEGWIKDEFLLKSSQIIASPSIDVSVYDQIRDRQHQEEHFHTFLSSTRDNNYLARDFISRMSAGKSANWIRKYVDCYLDFHEGAVYPDFSDALVEPFEIPKGWKRVAGFDFGFSDPTTLIMGAIDPKGILYIYDDYYQREKPVSFHAEEIHKRIDNVDMLYPIQADPAVRQTNNRDGTSYRDYMLRAFKINLQPANNEIVAGIERVRDYIALGKLKVFNSCTNLKKEARLYSYAKRETNTNDVPQDKDNHTMDALRYLVMRLPRDPNTLTEVLTKFDEYEDSGTVVEGFGLPRKGNKTVFGGLKI